MRSRRILLLLLALAALAAARPGTAGAKTVAVKLINIEFRPTRVALEPGDRIEFTNLDKFEHTILLVNAANPNMVVVPNRKLPPKSKFTTDPIETRGVFTLYCTLHGGMKAQVSTSGSFEITEAMRRAVAAVLPPEVNAGEDLFFGKAQCFRCHSVGKHGDADYGPNLEDIGLRARSRAKDRDLDVASDYLVESILHPAAYVVPGYANDMAEVYRPPVDIGKKELVEVVAYLQSQGGKVDLWEINIPDASVHKPAAPGLPIQPRNAVAGRELFMDMFSCASCHRTGERGGGVGPELTHIGAYRDEAFFMREILDPSAVVPSGYRPIVLDLKGAGGVHGVLRKETPEAYTVKLSDETVRTVPKSEVEKASIINDQSSMPRFEDMTVQQLADLLAFLESLQ